MNPYNIFKKYSNGLEKQRIPLFSLCVLLLFNLCSAPTLVAQNQDTTKAEHIKKVPDGESDELPYVRSPMNGLSERRLIKVPRIEDNSLISGQIVMAICVNEKGKVVSANYVPSESTISDAVLIRKVTQSAKQYKYAATNKKGEDCGTIKFRFINR